MSPTSVLTMPTSNSIQSNLILFQSMDKYILLFPQYKSEKYLHCLYTQLCVRLSGGEV